MYIISAKSRGHHPQDIQSLVGLCGEGPGMVHDGRGRQSAIRQSLSEFMMRARERFPNSAGETGLWTRSILASSLSALDEKAWLIWYARVSRGASFPLALHGI
ncbi:hypothetical protein V2G26_018053 [Clonostachys chloroleuca]